MSSTVRERKMYELLHHWNEGISSVPELTKLTKLPVSTVRYNVEKLKRTGTLEHKGGNGRPKKITANIAKTVGQSIRRDTSISLRLLATRLNSRGVDVSYRTVGRHLKSLGYKKKSAFSHANVNRYT